MAFGKESKPEHRNPRGGGFPPTHVVEAPAPVVQPEVAPEAAKEPKKKADEGAE